MGGSLFVVLAYAQGMRPLQGAMGNVFECMKKAAAKNPNGEEKHEPPPKCGNPLQNAKDRFKVFRNMMDKNPVARRVAQSYGPLDLLKDDFYQKCLVITLRN